MIGLTTRITKKLGLSLFSAFSHKNSLVNATPSKFVEQRASLKDNNWLTPDPTHKRSAETHLSNGEYLIHKIPVIHTDQAVVRCHGGAETGAGHPQVYIQLNTRKAGEPVSCKWCGLRYALKHHH